MTQQRPALARAGVILGRALARTEDPWCNKLLRFEEHTPVNTSTYWAYILASRPRGTLYIGVTNNIIERVEQHRLGVGSAFTRKYRVHTLVWLEPYGDVRDAIQREKSLKRYLRDWKINLIERDNPHWQDLYLTLPGVAPIPEDWVKRAAKLSGSWQMDGKQGDGTD